MGDEEELQADALQTAPGMVVLVYQEHIDEEDEVGVIVADALLLVMVEVDEEVEGVNSPQYAHEVPVTNE